MVVGPSWIRLASARTTVNGTMWNKVPINAAGAQNASQAASATSVKNSRQVRKRITAEREFNPAACKRDR